MKDSSGSSETADGATDVCSCKDPDSSTADHLVVMVNGILGSVTDWKFAAEQFIKTIPDKVFVHCSERNVAKQTLDGVDAMGERLAAEVLDVIKRKPILTKISFISHSVGGLVTRYTIGKLFRPSTGEENKKHTICGLEAVNFITVATPHLGSRGHRQVPFLFGVPMLEKLASCVIHLIFRRTGRHLFLTDNDEGKPPLLRLMLQDDGKYCFKSALKAFKRRVAYSNVGYDHVVGWRTSSIRRDSELPNWEDSFNKKYPHIVYQECCEAIEAEGLQFLSLGEVDADKLEDELVTGLSQVSWGKVDVSFHRSRQRFCAHSLIQVKDYTMHSEGADVIQHMIDHFYV